MRRPPQLLSWARVSHTGPDANPTPALDAARARIGLRMSYRLFGICVLTGETLAVYAGVKYISRVSPSFLIFVLL